MNKHIDINLIKDNNTEVAYYIEDDKIKIYYGCGEFTYKIGRIKDYIIFKIGNPEEIIQDEVERMIRLDHILISNKIYTNKRTWFEDSRGFYISPNTISHEIINELYSYIDWETDTGKLVFKMPKHSDRYTYEIKTGIKEIISGLILELMYDNSEYLPVKHLPKHMTDLFIDLSLGKHIMVKGSCMIQMGDK